MTTIDKEDLITQITHQVTAKLTWKFYVSVFISCIVTTASVVWTGATVYYGFQNQVRKNTADISNMQKKRGGAEQCNPLQH